MKISERVLLENGQFAPFNERLIERALETGARENAPVNIPDDPLAKREQGKAEVASKGSKQAKAQKEANKLPKPNVDTMLEGQPTGGEQVMDPQLPRKNQAKKLLEAKAMKNAAKAIADIIPENE